MLPEHLSVSQVNGWLMCPRRYRYRYLDRREPEHRSANLALGTAVHGAIGWWLEHRLEGVDLEASEVARMFRAGWLAEQDSAVALHFPKQTAEELDVLGSGLVESFLEQFDPECVPTAVERRFELPIPDVVNGGILPVPLVGFIDYEADGLVGEIKTTARTAKPSQWGLQLAAYSWAVRQETGERPEVELVQLVKTKVPKVDQKRLTVSDAEEAWFLEVASEVFHATRASVFPPNPGWQCDGCEFRQACRGS